MPNTSAICGLEPREEYFRMDLLSITVTFHKPLVSISNLMYA